MKYILVTGASSGIGASICEHLSKNGYSVIMVARSRERLEEVAGKLPQEPFIIPFDLTQLDRIEDIFKETSSNGILLDGMVHAAGENRDMPIKVNDISMMQEVMTVHYYAFVELGKYFYKKKYSNENAGIVAVSSLAGIRCDKGMCTYSASKSALDAAVSVMSKEFSKRGHRVNAILPAFVDTPMIRDEEHPIMDLEKKIAGQRMGLVDPLHVAYLAEFLLSDKAKYINDAHIPIGGGYVS